MIIGDNNRKGSKIRELKEFSVERTFVSPREFCEITGIPRGTVGTWISQCKIPSVKIGGSVLIPIEYVKEFRELNRLPREKGQSIIFW
jgi:excisionase family DNA binding protein